jgi:uncharacterized protein
MRNLRLQNPGRSGLVPFILRDDSQERILSMPDPRDVSVYQLLSKMVCAIVDRPRSLIIETLWVADGAAFTARSHPDDIGKVIGRQGRNAHSLRVILSGGGQELHRRMCS